MEYELIEQVFDYRIDRLGGNNREVVQREIGEDSYLIASRGEARMFYEHAKLRHDVLLTLEIEVLNEKEADMQHIIRRVIASFPG